MMAPMKNDLRSVPEVTVVGAGLAGSEAAWQLALRGVRVKLFEMRPRKYTPAHTTDKFAELVCSNSLGSNVEDTPAGILKNELRRFKSLVMQCADEHAVPAGRALAVDRESFSQCVTEKLRSHPMIEINCKEVEDLPDGLAIVATGPLTSESLASRLKEVVGEDFLYFFDAVAPIVTAESIDMSKAYRASRYGKGEDYINCPLTEEEYYAFWEELVSAERIPLKDFERDGKFFEGCMPVEVLAQRGKDTLRYGPMRPVGLEDPKDGKRPFAVVQLRQENKAGTMYNLVGFQTNLKWKEQERVFRMIPALKNAEFVRFGVMHRNIYVNAPKVLDGHLRLKARSNIYLAGQITGVEGYVESTAMGLVAGINAACQARGLSLPLWPMETAIGSLMNHLSEERPHGFQPMNMNLGLFPPLGERIKDRSQRLARHAERAKRALEAFLAENKMLVIEKD